MRVYLAQLPAVVQRNIPDSTGAIGARVREREAQLVPLGADRPFLRERCGPSVEVLVTGERGYVLNDSVLLIVRLLDQERVVHDRLGVGTLRHRRCWSDGSQADDDGSMPCTHSKRNSHE